MNGAPLRLVVPGWPGSCSQKWLTRIQIRDQIHDGPKMTGTSYRVPNRPVAPGENVAKEDFEIIERMPVKSLITSPQTNTEVNGNEIAIRGHAWSGDRKVIKVQISIDFGATWMDADLAPPANDGAWQTFNAKVKFLKRVTTKCGRKQLTIKVSASLLPSHGIRKVTSTTLSTASH